MNKLFEGSGVALVTPFDSEGVNEGVLRELIEFQIAGGTRALVLCGSTGEASTMSAEEHARVIAVGVESAAGRIPVVAGVGGSDTAVVARLGRAAARQGADALLISPPPYNKPTQKGIIAHYQAVIEAADLPVIIYNIPGRTVCNILPDTLEELAADPRVVGIKEASGDISQVGEIAARMGDRLAIYSGNDDQLLPILALGGSGVISVLANIRPAEMATTVTRFLEGDLQGAREVHFRNFPLIQALFRESNPIPVKAAVRLLGFEVGEVRLPLTPATQETLAQLQLALQEGDRMPHARMGR